MEVLKIILIVTAASLGIGFALVTYALRSGIHVPTNSEIINGTKVYMNAMKESKKKEAKKDVKASNIKKLSTK